MAQSRAQIPPLPPLRMSRHTVAIEPPDAGHWVEDLPCEADFEPLAAEGSAGRDQGFLPVTGGILRVDAVGGGETLTIHPQPETCTKAKCWTDEDFEQTGSSPDRSTFGGQSLHRCSDNASGAFLSFF
jgi:hypothetical protein